MVTHNKYFYFLMTCINTCNVINTVLARSRCQSGQFWEHSTESCVSCVLICQHSDQKRTAAQCASKCPGYIPVPPLVSNTTPVQQHQTGITVPHKVADDTQSSTMLLVTVLPAISIVGILVVILIKRRIHRANFIPVAQFADMANPDEGRGLPKIQQPVSDEHRQSLLYSLPTEETCRPDSDSNNHSDLQQNLPAVTESRSVCPHQQEHDLDETTPKSSFNSGHAGHVPEELDVHSEEQHESHVPRSSHSDRSDRCPVDVPHGGGAIFQSFVDQEEEDTLLKEQDEPQTPGSRLSDESSRCFDVPHHYQPQQSSPCDQDVILLLGGQTCNPAVVYMHDKMGVQVQDGAEEYEETSLCAVTITQPEILLPTAGTFSTSSQSHVSHRSQAVVRKTENSLVCPNELFTREFAVHSSVKPDRNVNPDSLYTSPVMQSQPALYQISNLTNIPSPSSIITQDLRNIPVPLTSMPTLPPFVDQTDSFSY